MNPIWQYWALSRHQDGTKSALSQYFEMTPQGEQYLKEQP